MSTARFFSTCPKKDSSPIASPAMNNIWSKEFSLSPLQTTNHTKISLERTFICKDAVENLTQAVHALEKERADKISNTASFVVFEQEIFDLVKNAYDANASLIHFSLYATEGASPRVIIRSENNGKPFVDHENHMIESMPYGLLKQMRTEPSPKKGSPYLLGGRNIGLVNISDTLEEFAGTLMINGSSTQLNRQYENMGCTVDLIADHQPDVDAHEVKVHLRKHLSKYTNEEANKKHEDFSREITVSTQDSEEFPEVAETWTHPYRRAS